MLKTWIKIILPAVMILPNLAAADVNVAVIAPMSGEYQKQGQEVISGAKIAADEINADGGLQGERVNLVTIDDPCHDLLEVSTAQMIAVNSSSKDKMNLVIGPYCTNSFSKVADVYAKGKILQIMPTPVADVDVGKSHQSLIKMVPGTEQQSKDFFKFYLNNFNNKKLALVYDSRRKDVVEMAADLQNEFNAAGKSLDFKSFNFANYNDDFAKMADDIVDDGFTMAYIAGEAMDVSRLAGELKREKKRFVLIANRYQVGKVFLDELGSLANGAYLLGLPSLKDNPNFTETLVKMRLLGVEPEGLSVYSYSAVKLWEDMVHRTKSFSYSKLSAAIKNGSFNTAWGDVAFVNGQPQNTVKYSIYQINDGEYTQVY